jgi:raffinose/stachyose/melibiose transport system substrate-binding protein
MMKRAILNLALVTVFATASLAAQTLTVWDFKYSEVNATGAQAPMKANDAAFEKANPGVKVVHVAQPTVDTQYYPIIQSAAAVNDGPDVAMFHPGARVEGFADIIVDLDPYIKDVKGQFTAASIEMCSVGGKVKVLPITMQGFGIYYNKALFKKAGLDPEKAPKSSADFLAACEKLKAAGIVPITTGQTYTIDFFLRCQAANAYGPNVAGLFNGTQKFDNPVFKESAAFMKTLVDKGYIEKDGFSRPYFMDSIDKFGTPSGGAIFIGLLSDVGNWKAFSDALGVNNVGYFPAVNFPDAKYKDQQVMQGAGIGYGVMKWSKNQKLAAAYVKFVSTGEGAKTYSSATGSLSPNTQAAGGATTYPVLKVIQNYLKSGQKDYIPLGYNGYEDEANRLCDRAFVTGEISIDKFIDEYQKLITK